MKSLQICMNFKAIFPKQRFQGKKDADLQELLLDVLLYGPKTA
jgi:hypothetical protein